MIRRWFRYRRYAHVVRYEAGRRERLRAYGGAIRGWLNSQVGQMGRAWDVTSNDLGTTLYFALATDRAHFMENFGDLLAGDPPPGFLALGDPWASFAGAVR